MRRPGSPIAFLALIVATLVLWGTPASIAAANADSANVLDHERADVTVLSPGPDGAHRLLVIDPPVPGSLAVRAGVLERGDTGVWWMATSLDVSVPPIDVARTAADPASVEPWLVALDGHRSVLIVASEERGETTLVPIVARNRPDTVTLSAGEPVTLPAVIDDAGVADVDADGAPELVVASARTLRQGGTCQSSSLWVLDTDLRIVRTIDVPERRLASGVLGEFDEVAGEDLVAYANPNCPAGPDVFAEQRLVIIRLIDGTIPADRRASAAGPGPDWSGPPVRYDADGDGRHELLVRLVRGLLIVDPHRDWADIRVASDAAFPLGAAIATDVDGGRAARVAWLEPSIDGRASIGTELVRRDANGALDSGPATVMWQPATRFADRWTAAVVDAIAAASRQSGPVGYRDAASDPDCADLVVPLAIVPCAGSDLLPGPAWLATRPVAAVGPPGERRVVNAVATVRGGATGLPISPTPWGGGPDGRWRHGPSAPFALAEVQADDLFDGRPFVPAPTVDRDAAVGPAATLGGAPGLRLIATIGAAASDAPEPAPDPGILDVLGRPPAGTDGISVIRLPVEPGAAAGAGRGTTTIDLSGATVADGSRAERWAVTTVALDDRGEVSEVFATTVRVDVVAPELVLTAPDVTPIWPFPASITGSAEPGATIRDESGDPIPVTPDGAFVVERTLGPWPQEIRVLATDAFGNEGVATITVVGGIDYRGWTWPAIIAGMVIVAAIASGIVGTRWRRGDAPAGSLVRAIPDEWPAPELEELAPGERTTAER